MRRSRAGIRGVAVAAALSALLVPAAHARTTSAAPTAARVVAAADQSGTLVVLPPIAQQGVDPRPPSDMSVVTAQFLPAVAGRTVLLQELVGRKWQTVQTAAQDAAGYAVFSVPTGRTYRAQAVPGGRAKSIDTAPVTSRAWAVDFEDQFSGTSLDPAVWRDSDRPYNPAGGRTCAKPSALAHQVSDGVLRLGVLRDPARIGEVCSWTTPAGAASSPYLLNSQVDTQGRYAFTHGFAAARMKLHQPRGMHDAFWMNPANGFTPGDPSRGAEIDVVEFFNGERDPASGVGAFVHALDASGAWTKRGQLFPSTELLKPAGDSWWTSFHVFSVEWTPTAYVFRVDGREFYRLTDLVSRSDQYLLLSMLTSDFELAYLDDSDLGATASVDWVRVWQ